MSQQQNHSCFSVLFWIICFGFGLEILLMCDLGIQVHLSYNYITDRGAVELLQAHSRTSTIAAFVPPHPLVSL